MMKTIAVIFALSLSPPAPAIEPPAPLSVFCIFATAEDGILVGVEAASEDAAKVRYAAHFKEESEVLVCETEQGGTEK